MSMAKKAACSIMMSVQKRISARECAAGSREPSGGRYIGFRAGRAAEPWPPAAGICSRYENPARDIPPNLISARRVSPALLASLDIYLTSLILDGALQGEGRFKPAAGSLATRYSKFRPH